MDLAAAVLLLLGAQPEEQARVFEATRASVVALRSPDGYGSGLLLDAKGLILTNAHVMVSPESYTVEVEGPRTAVYRSVRLVGVHPTLDLALVRIDPAEHAVGLKPMKRAEDLPEISAPVYAVGFPSSRGGREKVITGGRVRAVDHYIRGSRYIEISNEIWTGNSGGPLCNQRGELVGIITLSLDDGFERSGAAIPVDGLKPELFVPLRDRAANPSAAHRYLQGAEQELKRARAGRRESAATAETLFLLALMEDINNADTYFKIGLIRRNTGKSGSAVGYITRALLLDPAPSGGAQHYAELGIAFAQSKKKTEARAVWHEGLAKYPEAGGFLWDALAVDHWQEGRYLEAAVASRAAGRAFGPRGAVMNELYEQCLQRLDPGGRAELQRREDEIDAVIADFGARGEAARKAGRAFVFPDCEEALRSVPGLPDAGPAAPPPGARPSVLGEADRLSDEQVLRLFLEAQVRIAREQVRAGRIDQAVEALEDVVKAGPGSPQAKEARTLLDLIRENRK